jgi:hypothetical protein
MSGLLSSSLIFYVTFNRSPSGKSYSGVTYFTSDLGVSSLSNCFVSRFLRGVDLTLAWGKLYSTSLSLIFRRLLGTLITLSSDSDSTSLSLIFRRLFGILYTSSSDSDSTASLLFSILGVGFFTTSTIVTFLAGLAVF